MTGGYSLIDCFDVNITSDPVKIEGIFKKYQMSKRKAFLLSNVTINNTQLNDVFSTPYFEDGKVCFPAYDGIIKISDTDYVTFDMTADVIADKYLSKEDFLTIESDNAPYVSRSARNGLVKMPLVGATVAWNQLVKNPNCSSPSYISASNGTVSVSNNVASFTASAKNGTLYFEAGKRAAGHKIIMIATIQLTTATDLVRLYSFGVESSKYFSSTTNVQTLHQIVTASSDANTWNFQIIDGRENDWDAIKVFFSNAIDLTQMFGTTIADYVYSLEQTTADSGIAWLKSYGFFTKDYYAYDAGSLQSVCTSGRKITALDGTVRTYPIDNEELRGLFKLDANNKLYADGDIYPSSGNGTRKYGILNLGSIDWTSGNADSSGLYRWNGSITLNSIRNANAICSRFLYNKTSVHVVGQEEILIHGVDIYPFVWTKQSYADATAFKTAMDGVYLVYELAEPTTFSADPYINPQRSEGTEEFVDGLTRDVMIPVGNNSTYYKDELFNIIGEYIDSCDDAVIAMIPEGE